MQHPRVEPYVGASRSGREFSSGAVSGATAARSQSQDVSTTEADENTAELADNAAADQPTIDVPKDAAAPCPLTAPPLPSGMSTAQDLQVGRALRGRYVLHRLIGTGGTCRVFLAEDSHRRLSPASSGELIALKALRPQLRHPMHSLQRLRREFLQMQQLTHPAIARVFDLDCDAETWFITMELVDAPNALAWMATEYSNADALRVILTCCEALDYAHCKGVVHGDLKPGNVLIQGVRRVKLIDFGSVAGPEDRDALCEPKLQATPQYASPAVLAGAAAEPSDDVFALGCLAYMILARGRHPFERKPATEAAHAQLRAPYIPGIPLRIFEVVARALAWDPAVRQSNVRELQHALLAAGLPRPTQSTGAGTAARDAQRAASAPSTPTSNAPVSSTEPASSEPQSPASEPQAAASKPPGDYSYLSKFRGYVAGPLMDVKLDQHHSLSATEPDPLSVAHPTGDSPAAAPQVVPSLWCLAAKPSVLPMQRAQRPSKVRKRSLVNALGLTLVLASAVGAALLSRHHPWLHSAQSQSASRGGELPKIVLPIISMPRPAMASMPAPSISIARSKPDKPSGRRSGSAKSGSPPENRVWFAARTMEVSPTQTLVAIPIRRSAADRAAMRVAWQIEADRGRQLLDSQRAGTQTIQFHEGQAIRTLYVPLRKQAAELAAEGVRSFRVKLQASDDVDTAAEIRVTLLRQLQSD